MTRDPAAEIRRRRHRLGWSQTRLARACGLSLSTIMRIEQPDCSPRYRTLARVLEVLDAAEADAEVAA